MPEESITHYSNLHHQPSTILLPNQMYPENSLMRTHSLGNIKNENQQQAEKRCIESDQVSLVSENRKHSEKEWLETSLDSIESLSPPTPVKIFTPPLLPSQESKHPFEPLTNSFDTVIILH